MRSRAGDIAELIETWICVGCLVLGIAGAPFAVAVAWWATFSVSPILFPLAAMMTLAALVVVLCAVDWWVCRRRDGGGR